MTSGRSLNRWHLSRDLNKVRGWNVAFWEECSLWVVVEGRWWREERKILGFSILCFLLNCTSLSTTVLLDWTSRGLVFRGLYLLKSGLGCVTLAEEGRFDFSSPCARVPVTHSSRICTVWEPRIWTCTVTQLSYVAGNKDLCFAWQVAAKTETH